MKLCISGIMGAVGRVLSAIAEDDPDIQVVAGLSRQHGYGKEVRDILKDSKTDVLIIFCNDPHAAAQQAIAASLVGVKVVLGTTGLTDRHFEMLEEAAEQVAVAYSSNFDLNAQWFICFAQDLSLHLESSGHIFSAEVFEVHSLNKKDGYLR